MEKQKSPFLGALIAIMVGLLAFVVIEIVANIELYRVPGDRHVAPPNMITISRMDPNGIRYLADKPSQMCYVYQTGLLSAALAPVDCVRIGYTFTFPRFEE